MGTATSIVDACTAVSAITTEEHSPLYAASESSHDDSILDAFHHCRSFVATLLHSLRLWLGLAAPPP